MKASLRPFWSLLNIQPYFEQHSLLRWVNKKNWVKQKFPSQLDLDIRSKNKLTKILFSAWLGYKKNLFSAWLRYQKQKQTNKILLSARLGYPERWQHRRTDQGNFLRGEQWMQNAKWKTTLMQNERLHLCKMIWT